MDWIFLSCRLVVALGRPWRFIGATLPSILKALITLKIAVVDFPNNLAIYCIFLFWAYISIMILLSSILKYSNLPIFLKELVEKILI